MVLIMLPSVYIHYKVRFV